MNQPNDSIGQQLLIAIPRKTSINPDANMRADAGKVIKDEQRETITPTRIVFFPKISLILRFFFMVFSCLVCTLETTFALRL